MKYQSYLKNLNSIIPIWNYLGLLILALSIVGPRILALDQFVTVDEATWVMRSANFYYALSQREFENTVTAYHPAVTTMWTGALGMLVKFPDYRGLGQGYFIKEWKFMEFLIDHGHHPLEILKVSRLVTVVVNSLLILLIFFLGRKLLSLTPALIVTLVLSYEPYLLGHTRILAHEGMMSLFLLVSIFSYLIYRYKTGRRLYLTISAISGGLATLTKSSATIIIPFIALLIFVEIVTTISVPSKRQSVNWERVRRSSSDFVIWIGVFSLIYFVFWPSMWVNIEKSIYQVYGNAFSYTLYGRSLQATETDSSSMDEFDPSLSGLGSYFRSMLRRSTPVTWIGVLLAFVSLFTLRKEKHRELVLRTIVIFLLFAILFLIMMSLAGGRRAQHYIMSSYAGLDVVAGLGLYSLINFVSRRLSPFWSVLVPGLVWSGFIIIQVFSSLSFYPYYYNYANPIMRYREGSKSFHSGYGEVLELAASYLAKKPNANDSTVLSWRGTGPFSYFYPGKTENLLSETQWSDSLIERLRKSDYLVIYYEQQMRRQRPAKLLKDIADVPPEHSIWLNGIEYVRIYRVSDLPDEVYVPDVLD